MRRLSPWGLRARDIATPMEPPSWSAAPSRPAEPPVRWVSAVDRKIAGAILMLTPSWVRTVLMISSVPMVRGSFSRAYSPAMARPATGIKKGSQEVCWRKWVACSTTMANPPPTTPQTTPTAAAASTQPAKARI